MMTLLPKTNIDFIKKRFIFFGISIALILASVISLAVKGLNLGLDFTGGTVVQMQFKNPTTVTDLRQALAKAGISAELQSYTDRNAFDIRVKGAQDKVNEIGNRIKDAITAGMPDNTYSVEKMDFVGPTVGRDLAKKAIWAIVLSMFGIIVYVAFRFNNPIWGAMGVVALLHDVFIAIGALSITHRQVDLVIVAALLTIAGYSINDTIVIFDRMRENLHINPKMPLGELINLSINETLSRTIITSLTVIAAVAILFFMGGAVINDFAFTMLIGCVTGVYSTIAIATPLVYQWCGGQHPETEPVPTAEEKRPVTVSGKITRKQK